MRKRKCIGIYKRYALPITIDKNNGTINNGTNNKVTSNMPKEILMTSNKIVIKVVLRNKLRLHNLLRLSVFVTYKDWADSPFQSYGTANP
jgi:hypothetical protein